MRRQAKKNREKKVFVGLSGGVDSAVSAALLLRAGYNVTGVFIKVWQPEWMECNWKEERLEAMRVAAHLNIPFITLDLVKEYKRGVIDYMIAEYSDGRTPNPDVMCNREVKFGAFWRWAKEQGADYIATGHYARRVPSSMFTHSLEYSLIAGTDKNKDQSYFLWTLTQEDLSHTLFPVGGMTKFEVRKLARRFGLSNADKKDSQGLCFIGKVDFKEFLAHYTKNNHAAKPGNVLDMSGKVIGKHLGALFFTIGERHGFTVDSSSKSPHDNRLFVIDKNMKANTIIVADKSKISRENPDARYLILHPNWISGVPKLNKTLKARTRYRQPLEDMKITEIKSDKFFVTFKKRLDVLTPGQSLVVYDRNECIGGGIIGDLA